MATLKLKAQSIRFFSENDEISFFEWLRKIKGFVNVIGEREVLNIEFDTTTMADDHYREIIALFHRYNVDMKQLSVFETIVPEAVWFVQPHSYWFKHVFEEKE